MIPRRIVAIGTSAFFGLFDEDHKGGFIGRLKIWYEEKDIHHEVYNLGVSKIGAGETTGDMVKRIAQEVSARQPDLLFLTTGINDVRRIGGKDMPCITSKETFKKNVWDMIASARSIAKEIIFISAYPIKDKESSEGDFFLNADLEEYTRIAQKICAQEQIPFLDIFSQWQKDGYADFLGPDGVHANAKGYEKVFEQLKTFLLEYYS